MRRKVLVIGFVIQVGVSVSQDLPGLNYCLLFDSKLEKLAFQDIRNTNCDPVVLLLAQDPKTDSVVYKAVRDEIFDFTQSLEAKKRKYSSDLTFLNFVFNKVHQKYLRHFQGTETFNGIFNGGTYNCVSGTALYACILNLLNYQVKLYETRYHLFLVVTLSGGTHILFEATDPFEGFTSDDRKIRDRVQEYINDETKTLAKRTKLSAPFNQDTILQQVSFVQVAGLHYYNIGVDLVNKQNYFDAFRALRKASILYPSSERIKDLTEFTRMKYEVQLNQAFVNH